MCVLHNAMSITIISIIQKRLSSPDLATYLRTQLCTPHTLLMCMQNTVL